MKELFEQVNSHAVLWGTTNLGNDSAIMECHLRGIWALLERMDFPPQQLILLERMVNCVLRLRSNSVQDRIGVEWHGKMIHGHRECVANPATVFVEIFNNYFNSEEGIEKFNRFGGGTMGQIVKVKENAGGEWVTQIFLKDKCGKLFLTTWDND